MSPRHCVLLLLAVLIAEGIESADSERPIKRHLLKVEGTAGPGPDFYLNLPRAPALSPAKTPGSQPALGNETSYLVLIENTRKANYLLHKQDSPESALLFPILKETLEEELDSHYTPVSPAESSTLSSSPNVTTFAVVQVLSTITTPVLESVTEDAFNQSLDGCAFVALPWGQCGGTSSCPNLHTTCQDQAWPQVCCPPANGYQQICKRINRYYHQCLPEYPIVGKDDQAVEVIGALANNLSFPHVGPNPDISFTVYVSEADIQSPPPAVPLQQQPPPPVTYPPPPLQQTVIFYPPPTPQGGMRKLLQVEAYLPLGSTTPVLSSNNEESSNAPSPPVQLPGALSPSPGSPQTTPTADASTQASANNPQGTSFPNTGAPAPEAASPPPPFVSNLVVPGVVAPAVNTGASMTPQPAPAPAEPSPGLTPLAPFQIATRNSAGPATAMPPALQPSGSAASPANALLAPGIIAAAPGSSAPSGGIHLPTPAFVGPQPGAAPSPAPEEETPGPGKSPARTPWDGADTAHPPQAVKSPAPAPVPAPSRLRDAQGRPALPPPPPPPPPQQQDLSASNSESNPNLYGTLQQQSPPPPPAPQNASPPPPMVVPSPPPTQATPGLIWSDDFLGSANSSNGVDPTIWSFQNGNGSLWNIPGWGNNELQEYTEDNALVSNGQLTITASFNGSHFQSARLRTFGNQNFTPSAKDTSNGIRVEASVQLPTGGPGIWPAFWMLPSDGPKFCSGCGSYGSWPASGEIDIMDAINDMNTTFGSVHYGGDVDQGLSQWTQGLPGSPLSEGFHTYAVDWKRDRMIFSVDSRPYLTVNCACSLAEDGYCGSTKGWYTSNTGGAQVWGACAPFDRPFYIILNVAIGGGWAGNPTSATSFPQSMVVDFVRVYRL